MLDDAILDDITSGAPSGKANPLALALGTIGQGMTGKSFVGDIKDRARQERLDAIRNAIEQKRMQREGARDKLAQAAENRAQAQFKNAQEDRKVQESQRENLTNSASPESQMMRNLAKKLRPDMDFSDFNGAQIQRVLPQLETIFNAEMRRKAAEATANDRQEYRNERINIQKEKFADKQERDTDKDVQGLTKRLQDSGVLKMGDKLDQIDSILKAAGVSVDEKGSVKGDVPGFGRMGSLAPGFMVSEAGRDLRRLVQGLSNIELKERSGAAVTAQEFRRFQKEFGSGNFESEDQLVKALIQLKRAVETDKETIFQGFDDAALQKYQDRGGRIPESRDWPVGVVKTVVQGGKKYRVMKTEDGRFIPAE